MHTAPRAPACLAQACQPLIDAIRARRAWIRYQLHARIGEFYAQTSLRRNQVVYPQPIYCKPNAKDGPPNSIESEPWHANFPNGYHDILLARVRWRHRAWRTHSSSSPRISGKQDPAKPEPPPGAKYLVWLDEWRTDTPPGRHLLASWGIINPSDQKDYQRRFETIYALARAHDRLLEHAYAILRTADTLESAMGDTCAEFGIPLPPPWLNIPQPGQPPH